MFWRVISFTLPLWCSLLSTGFAAREEYPRSQLLLEPADLVKHGVAKRFIILDARKKEAYDEQHIPGARWVDHDSWKDALGDGDDVEGWSKRIGDLGIAADSSVVVYDDMSNKNAARIWWILRYWGVKDARLLNGGWKSWISDGLAATADVPPPADTVKFHAVAEKKRLVTAEQVVASLNDHQLQIVDARSEDEFCGIDLKENERGGAIPGARHLEWSDLIDHETDRFKSPTELRRLFEQAGIDLNRPTASHCQSGGRASVMAFALELMGAKDSRNYYRGWSEWGNRDDLPIVTPDKR